MSTFTGSGMSSVVVTLSRDVVESAGLPADLARVRDAYGSFKLATVEFAEACYAASQNGRSQRKIAESAGCSKNTVLYVLRAYGQSLTTGEPFSEVFTSITNTNRKPKPPTDPKSATNPPVNVPVNDDDDPGILEGRIVGPGELEIRDVKYPAPSFDPLAALQKAAELAWHLERRPDQLDPMFLDTLKSVGPLIEEAIWENGSETCASDGIQCSVNDGNVSDEPCIMNAIVTQFRDMASPSFTKTLTPLDRRNLHSELARIMKRLEKEGLEPHRISDPHEAAFNVIAIMKLASRLRAQLQNYEGPLAPDVIRTLKALQSDTDEAVWESGSETCASSGTFDPETGATIDVCGIDDSLNRSIKATEDWVKGTIRPGTKMNRKQHDKLERMLKTALKNLEKVEVIE